MVDIELKWCAKMPPNNKLNLNAFLQELFKKHWVRRFTSDSVIFQCDDSLYSFDAQQLFDTNVTQMLPASKTKKRVRPQITKKQNEITITKEHIKKEYIFLVEWYVGNIISQEIKDLILFFYA
eukprot:263366_1